MMYCKKCGHQILENEELCSGCKTPIAELKKTNDIIYKEEVKEDSKGSEIKGVNPIFNEFTPEKDKVKSADSQDFFGNEQYDASKYLDSTRANTFLLRSVIVILSLILIAIGSYLVWDKIINKSTEETTNKINYQGFIFAIPTDFNYEIVSNSLYVSNNAKTWTAQISIANLSYNQLVLNKTTLNDNLMLLYGASEAIEQVANNSNYLTMDAVSNSSNFVIALSKASTTKTFVITIPYMDSDFKYNPLDELSSILLNTKVNKQVNINEINYNDNILTSILK